VLVFSPGPTANLYQHLKEPTSLEAGSLAGGIVYGVEKGPNEVYTPAGVMTSR